jgi:hypothetical protein
MNNQAQLDWLKKDFETIESLRVAFEKAGGFFIVVKQLKT